MTSLSSTSSSASDGHAADRIIPIAVEENAVYQRPTSNQSSSNKSTNNLMTASCPNSQALLRANNHITTPSRSAKRLVKNVCIKQRAKITVLFFSKNNADMHAQGHATYFYGLQVQ